MHRRLLSICLLIAIAHALHAATPYIQNITKYARPGQVITIQGNNFATGGEAPEIWLDVITGSSDSPNPETRCPELLTYTDFTASVRLPVSLPVGLYAIMVINGDDTQSAPAWVNRAEPFQALDVAGRYLTSGFQFRVSGWAMGFQGTTPTARFVRSYTIDNMDAGFSYTGDWELGVYPWDSFYGTNKRSDRNKDKGTKTATFTTTLPAGSYEVLSYNQSYYQLATNVPYDIVHSGGTTTVTVDQKRNADDWQSLGTYTFGTTATVVIRTDGTNGMVYADAIRFRPLDTSSALVGTATASADPYMVDVTAPSGLFAGQVYDLYLSNGFGGTYGEDHSLWFEGETAGTDYWNIDVPWAGRFDFYGNIYDVTSDSRLALHAVGDGVTDDSAAIQAAIYAARDAGGGVVYLPDGDYLVNATLNFDSNRFINVRVVLEGQSKSGTRLIKTLTDNASMFSDGDDGYIGFASLSMIDHGGIGTPYRLFNSRFAFVKDVHLESNGGSVLYINSANCQVVTGCDIVAKATTGKYCIYSPGCFDLLLKDNYVQWSDGRLYMVDTKRQQLEGNDFMRTVATDGSPSPYGYGGPAINNSNETAILNNLFGKIGSGAIPQANDGETILNEHVERLGVGHINSASATTMTDSSQAWDIDETAGFYAVIIEGKGYGQWRRIASNTATQITLEEPWQVTPDSTSNYAIVDRDEHTMIKGNEFNGVPRAIWLYSSTNTDVIIADNDFIDSTNIYMRADQRMFDDHGRFSMFHNLLIENNSMINANDLYPVQLALGSIVVTGDTELFGNGFHNAVVRENYLEAGIPNNTWGEYGLYEEGYFLLAQDTNSPCVVDDSIGLSGVVMDSNIALNTDYAIQVNTGTTNTVVWNTYADNIVDLFDDIWLTGSTHGADLWSGPEDGLLYLHTFDDVGSVKLDQDATNPVNFFDYIIFGSITATAQQPTGLETATNGAAPSGVSARFDLPAGTNGSICDHYFEQNYTEVAAEIATWPAGTYTIELGFDYATNYEAVNIELLLFSDNSNQDSGGNDRWEPGKYDALHTGGINAFSRYTRNYTFTLVDSSAPSTRPEGTFGVGTFSGFSLHFTMDARQSGDPALAVRVDNLTIKAVAGPPVFGGLVAEFYDFTTNLSTMPDLSGLTPDLVRTDDNVNYYPSTSAIWDGLPAGFDNQFASRHTGSIYIAESGTYTFYIGSDDGSLLYIDGSLLINNDGLHGWREYNNSVYLEAGYHDIRADFFENGGSAGLRLRWAGPSFSTQVIPASVLSH